MYSRFTDYLLAKAPFTTGELSKIGALTYKRKVKKGEILFEEGSQWPYNGFVCKGLMHNYTGIEGNEKTLSFAPENYWLGDRDSLLTGKPMRHSARAIEKTTIVYIENDDFEKLRIVIPRFNEMMQDLIQKHISTSQQRLSQEMIQTDEERYAGFLAAKPALLGRIPAELIGSYLNISPQSLDRIVNGISLKK